MRFDWTTSQRELYERTVQFARTRLADLLRDHREQTGLPLAAWRACGEFGLLGLCIPAEHDGMGLDALTTALIVEALGKGCEDAGLVFAACAHMFACAMPIADHASEAQRRAALPSLCSGAWVGANAISEADAGSDVFALKTHAERRGDRYVLSGAKSYVTNGPEADVILTYASTDPAAGYLGITAFLVRADAAGVRIGAPFAKQGLASSSIASVYFDDCEVPIECRVGEEGDGARIFQRSMLWERSCLFASYIGIMERQLEQTIQFAKERRQFRKSIGKFQAVGHRIVEMKHRLESARLLLYRACWQLSRNQDAVMASALAKLAVSEAAVQSALDAIQIHGASGVMSETRVDQMLHDALPSRIFSGTSEMQREIIARELGL